MTIKYYTLSIPIKKELGKIIKTLRTHRLKELSSEHLIDSNPYTKERFCENNKICHYHTLTKLETDYVREDNVYHKLLHKLNLNFQLKKEEHESNMKYLLELRNNLFKEIEYLDNSLENVFENIQFNHDCIAKIHFELLRFSRDTIINQVKDSKMLQTIESYLPLFDKLYLALANQACGYSYILEGNYEKAESYIFEAIKYYDKNNISIGLSRIPLTLFYIQTNQYYEAVNLCNQLEEYYIQTNNKKRLMFIYSHLVDYYLLINSKEFAEKYYNEVVFLAREFDDDSSVLFLLYYNYGYHNLKNYQIEEALKQFILAYDICKQDSLRLIVINRILICLTKLNYPEDDIDKYLQEGDKIFSKAVEIEQLIFMYFIYKKNQKNFIEFGAKNIISKIKNMDKYKIIRLFFYEDLYNLNQN